MATARDILPALIHHSPGERAAVHETLLGARLCICGHPRRNHEHASDSFPAVCIYEVAPGEDYPLCHCLEFEEE